MKEYKLKIKVTKEILEKSMLCGTDIKKGFNKNNIGNSCAIALAVREIFPKAWVSNGQIYITGNFIPKYNIDLPIEACRFIKTFDTLKCLPEERLVLPELEFEVIIPQLYIESINIDEIKESLKESKTLELI